MQVMSVLIIVTIGFNRGATTNTPLGSGTQTKSKEGYGMMVVSTITHGATSRLWRVFLFVAPLRHQARFGKHPSRNHQIMQLTISFNRPIAVARFSAKLQSARQLWAADLCRSTAKGK